MDAPRPKKKIIIGKDCVRHLRFSTSLGTTAKEDDSIQVYARIRPLDKNETSFLEYDSTSIKYNETSKQGCIKTMMFSFHDVFSPNISQNTLFRTAFEDDINKLIDGEDRLLFAYGTTGSGKTYTVLGTNSEPGLLARSTFQLFSHLDEMVIESPLCPDQGVDVRRLTEEEYQRMLLIRAYISEIVEDLECKPNMDEFSFKEKDVLDLLKILVHDYKPKPTNLITDCKYTVWVSYLEVYNENIYDLLDPWDERKPLKIGYDSKKNNYVKGLTHINVDTWVKLWRLFIFGRSRLHTNKTELNNQSSRSHSVFTVKLMKFHGNNRTTVSSLSICDLAGCERQKKALTEGSRLAETKSINTSIMVLNRCFASVRENKVNSVKRIVPYRNSKLTLIFQKAFSYGEHITMIVNLSQHVYLSEETKNVLKMSAVAQEMVKAIPKNFIKPQSRFSIMCLNPEAPFCRRNVQGHSGVMVLSTTQDSSTSQLEESLRQRDNTIKQLEEVVNNKEEEIKGLLEMLEDARSEYLQLETKFKESQRDLAEAEVEIEELQNDYDDLKTIFDTKINVMEDTENCLTQAQDEIASLKMDLETAHDQLDKLTNLESKNIILRDANERLTVTVEELTAEIKELRLKPKPTKGRALLSCVENIEIPSSALDPLRGDEFDTVNGVELMKREFLTAPGSSRKHKKIDNKEFEVLSGRIRRSPRSTSKAKKLEWL